jgi:hypothetical protein
MVGVDRNITLHIVYTVYNIYIGPVNGCGLQNDHPRWPAWIPGLALTLQAPQWRALSVRTRQNSTALNCSTQRGTPKGSLPAGISIGNDQNQNLVDQDPWNISSSDICNISTKSQRDHINSNHSMIISESLWGSESLKPPLRAYLWGWQCGRHTALLRSARQRSRMASRRKLGLTPAGWSNTVR